MAFFLEKLQAQIILLLKLITISFFFLMIAKFESKVTVHYVLWEKTHSSYPLIKHAANEKPYLVLSFMNDRVLHIASTF